jgi:hypothetical protein
LQRLTVSLPDETLKRVKRISRESGLKVSQIVARALEQHLDEQAQIDAEAPVRPTVLWKLKGRKSLRAPSPRLERTRVGSWRIIDLDELSLQT